MTRHRRTLWTVAIAGWVWAFAVTLDAQVIRLPAVEPDTPVYGNALRPPAEASPREAPTAVYPEHTGAPPGPIVDTPPYPGKLTAYPDSTAELPQRPLEFPPLETEDEPDLPPGARPGMFQKAIFSSTWLAPGGRDGFGMSEMEGKLVVAFPFPLKGSHLVLTPGFGVHYLDGPQDGDLPPQLFESYTQVRVMWPVREGLAFDVAVTPGVFSDFQQESDEAFRIAGHGAVMYQWNPTLKLLVGVAYPAREDASVLPIGGLIWTPNDDWSVQIVGPRPKIARRLHWASRQQPGVEQWLYMAGEWGGGSWAIRRTDGVDDVVTLSDFRVILGWERTNLQGLNALFEVGYVFAREIEYDRGFPGQEPADTIMLRGSLTY